ncbi:MAG: fluoride efflux transporter CrcB [Candidatus Binatia bacterium]
MDKVLLIGLGGFIGSIARYALGSFVQGLTRTASFPYGTLAVNCIGCVLIGFLSALAESRGVFSGELRAFLFIGVLGGFTTFSAFGNETMQLLRDAESLLAAMNIVAHLALGLGGVWLGRLSVFLLWR